MRSASSGVLLGARPWWARRRSRQTVAAWLGRGPSVAAPTAGGGATPAFESFLKNEVETTAKDLRASETQSVQALAGKADLQQVVEAVTQAELSLQKVTAVRDRQFVLIETTTDPATVDVDRSGTSTPGDAFLFHSVLTTTGGVRSGIRSSSHRRN